VAPTVVDKYGPTEWHQRMGASRHLPTETQALAYPVGQQATIFVPVPFRVLMENVPPES